MPVTVKVKKSRKTEKKGKKGKGQTQQQTVNITFQRSSKSKRGAKPASAPLRPTLPPMTQTINLSTLFPPPPQYYQMLRPDFIPAIPQMEAGIPIPQQEVVVPPPRPQAPAAPVAPEPDAPLADAEPFVMVAPQPPPPPAPRGTLAGRIARRIGRGALAGLEALGEVNLNLAVPPAQPRMPEMAPVRIQPPAAPEPMIAAPLAIAPVPPNVPRPEPPRPVPRDRAAPAPEEPEVPEMVQPIAPRPRPVRRRVFPDFVPPPQEPVPEMAPIAAAPLTPAPEEPKEGRFRLSRRRVKIPEVERTPVEPFESAAPARIRRKKEPLPRILANINLPVELSQAGPSGVQTRSKTKKALDPEGFHKK